MTHHIEESAYQGYMWKSDEQTPEVYDCDRNIGFCLSDGENPFIAEGQLYDKATDVSISIKFIDGKYIINRYDGRKHQFIGGSDSAIFEEGELEQYIPARRMDTGSRVLNFIRLWKVTKDQMSENFETLCPSALIFKGFGTRIKGGSND